MLPMIARPAWIPMPKPRISSIPAVEALRMFPWLQSASQPRANTGSRARHERDIIAAPPERLFETLVPRMPRDKNNWGYPLAFHTTKGATKVEDVHPGHFDIE